MPTKKAAAPASIGELAERNGEAWNAHDLDAIMALHCDDVAFRARGWGQHQEWTGLDQCREAYGYLLQVLPDQRFEVQELLVADDHFVGTSILTATLALPWTIGDSTFEPRGQRIECLITDIVTCEGDLIQTKTSWVDGVSISRQLAG